jgi:hypothetical protein
LSGRSRAKMAACWPRKARGLPESWTRRTGAAASKGLQSSRCG